MEDTGLRLNKAMSRTNNIRLRNDWVHRQKTSLYQGHLDDVNRQVERPMVPFGTKEELNKKQDELSEITANLV